jgi:hypothetical protein
METKDSPAKHYNAAIARLSSGLANLERATYAGMPNVIKSNRPNDEQIFNNRKKRHEAEGTVAIIMLKMLMKEHPTKADGLIEKITEIAENNTSVVEFSKVIFLCSAIVMHPDTADLGIERLEKLSKLKFDGQELEALFEAHNYNMKAIAKAIDYDHAKGDAKRELWKFEKLLRDES